MIDWLASFFGASDAALCILCGKSVKREEAALTVESNGICSSCMRELEDVSNTGSFEGTAHTSFILAPYFYRGRICHAIHQLKFRGAWAYGGVFAELMIEYLNGFTHMKNYDMLTPVPLSKNRYRERGYNQVQLISDKVCAHFGIENGADALERVKNTRRQSSLSGLARRENVRKAFCARSDRVKDKKIIVMDDIITTGCTVDACAEALLNAGAKEVIALGLAYVCSERKNRFM